MKYNELEGPIKKELHIFYVLDTSGSMIGAPIGALNEGMSNTVNELRKKDGEDVNLKIAVLEFNSSNRWITQGTNGVENLQDFVWTNLEASGLTRLGGALRELNKSMTRNDKLKAEIGHKTPVVIFMSDGEPNDDWEAALEELAKNGWYQHAIKIAFALGELADTNVLAKVVGVRPGGAIVPAPEAVLQINDLQTFSEMVQVMSVNSVMISSVPKGLAEGDETGTGVVQKSGLKSEDGGPIKVNPEDVPQIFPGPAPTPAPDPGYPDDGGFGDLGPAGLV